MSFNNLLWGPGLRSEMPGGYSSRSLLFLIKGMTKGMIKGAFLEENASIKT